MDHFLQTTSLLLSVCSANGGGAGRQRDSGGGECSGRRSSSSLGQLQLSIAVACDHLSHPSAVTVTEDTGVKTGCLACGGKYREYLFTMLRLDRVCHILKPFV